MGKSQKVFFTVLCANLLMVSIYSYIFIEIRQKNQLIIETSSAIETLTAQKESLKSVEKTVSETSSLREKIDKYFIPKDGVVQFLDSIESLGAGNNLAIKIVSVSVDPSSVSPDIFEMVNVRIEVSGAWSDAYRFAALVELMPFKISVGRVNLEKISVKGDKAGLLWKGSLDIGVLKLK